MEEEIFIPKYKPYYLCEFGLDEKRMQLLRTLYEIEDVNILLVGSQSSGKTTLLYAMIREYYNIKKESMIPDTNILFINQLKEQGIHYFRNEMKTFCQSRCSIHGKKKMIVIDDIDNLNEQSQQVFRNYIDKYKQNVHMISSCTNIQKVIESIQSRIHIIKLELPKKREIEKLMERIVEENRFSIEEKALEKIKSTIEKENENIVQMISKMEKMYIYNYKNKAIEQNEIEKMTSNIKKEDLTNYIQYVKTGKLNEAIKILQENMEGYSVIDILDHLYNYVKETEQLTESEKYKMIPLLCKYITIFNKIHEDHIELAIFTNDLTRIFLNVGVP
jgi:DNA polymerase III delta prime subunit